MLSIGTSLGMCFEADGLLLLQEPTSIFPSRNFYYLPHAQRIPMQQAMIQFFLFLWGETGRIEIQGSLTHHEEHSSIWVLALSSTNLVLEIG